MPQNPFLHVLLLAILVPVLPALPILPNPDPAPIQTPFSTSSSSPFSCPPKTPATIPAFPEQSDVAGCPLDLPDELFTDISRACGGGKKVTRTRCCPVLATWLYAAYSGTALERASRMPAEPNYDLLPVLPDDSETCVNTLEEALSGRGIELERKNGTCNAVYCYCGIRLHGLSCPEIFSVSGEGKLVGDGWVKRLEGDCRYSSNAGCSNCLNSLYQLKNGGSQSERKSKIHDRDCEMMGLTWLLAKNTTLYVPTVSSVLRVFMMGRIDGSSDPRSCSLGRDGMPLAVDSAVLNDPSSSTTLRFPANLLLLIHFLYIIFSTSF
ncbi:putative GPI-anchored protein At4g28100 [Tasmannia lanceolata]|uniref:putative GPI-anchored protein At4g28100 n=1 Tax=Tasmannia lanceolata TaxID=3420 RepID=UPI004063E8C1